MQTRVSEVENDLYIQNEANMNQKQLIEIKINEIQKIEFELQEQVGSYFLYYFNYIPGDLLVDIH